MDEKFIISKGWEKVGWINGHNTYNHKTFNLVNDNFYIEMKTYTWSTVEIRENRGLEINTLFTGTLLRNRDLTSIMQFLDFDF